MNKVRTTTFNQDVSDYIYTDVDVRTPLIFLMSRCVNLIFSRVLLILR